MLEKVKMTMHSHNLTGILITHSGFPAPRTELIMTTPGKQIDTCPPFPIFNGSHGTIRAICSDFYPTLRWLPRFPDVICVVGNGPLGKEQRAAIRLHQFVIRFNDLKNMLEGEPLHLHVIRENGFGMFGEDKCTKPVAIVENPRRSWQQKRYSVRCNVMCRIEHPKTLFGADVTSHNGATTGAVLLQYLDNHPDVVTIHVFGMNWSVEEARRNRHQVNESTLIRNHAKKCIIHETPTSSYLPD